ncbi:XRE family transcriptional regulator [Eubacteriales bacterium OttesenSCG-928-A19]|nr:XRE family transcriptional regulator [Eubacteriales bacterium OttesenSCG-928-A19]
MSFQGRLREARRNKGLTREALGSMVGVAGSTIAEYESGDSKPDVEKIERMMDALDIDAGYLWQDKNGSAPHAFCVSDDEERAFVEKFRCLDEHGKKIVGFLLSEEAERAEEEREERERMHPASPFRDNPFLEEGRLEDVVSFRTAVDAISVDAGVYLYPDAFETIYVPRGALPRSAEFGIPVADDSMAPAYRHGDILIISGKQPGAGEVGVFILEGKGYIRRLSEEGLLPLREGQPPTPVREGIRSLGKVIGTLNPIMARKGQG